MAPSESHHPSCDPTRGRNSLVRQLEPIEWEALLGFPLGWSDPRAPMTAKGSRGLSVNWVDWQHASPSSFPEPIRDLVEMLQRSHGHGPIRTNDQGHVAFEFENTAELFGHRTGVGPLIVGMDTNVLIDYIDNINFIWADPEPMNPTRWNSRAGGLKDLMTLWSWRDIRFVIQSQQLDDAKRTLTIERREQRQELLDAFYTDTFERSQRDTLRSVRGGEIPVDVLNRLPAGVDRSLVTAALAQGCHAFLTEDRGIYRADNLLRRFGLRLLRTRELLEMLLMTAELTERRSLCGVVPDSHGMTHVITGVSTDYARRLTALADT